MKIYILLNIRIDIPTFLDTYLTVFHEYSF